MAPLTPQQSLARLRGLYYDAFKCEPETDETILRWANAPETWATHQILARGWTFLAAEAVVRQCRILRSRATRAVADALLAELTA